MAAMSLLLVVIPSAPVASAAPPIDSISIVEENLAEVEADLAASGTDVISELDAMLSDYRGQLAASDLGRSEKNSLREQIATVEELRSDYIGYSSGYQAKGVTHPVYSVAVATISTWFYAKGYTLSNELLLHAKNNSRVNSSYTPVYNGNADRVLASTVFTKLKYGTKTSGTASFPNSGNVAQKDLYYAIHAFSWTKSGGFVTLRDRYDFAPGDYNGIAGTAVNTMYLAQQAGVLVPFYLSIRK